MYERSETVSKRTKSKKGKRPDPTGIIAGLVLVIMGLASLYGWWELDPLYFKIPLYIIASFLIGIGALVFILEFTVGTETKVDRSNYAMAAMFLVGSASLAYPAITADIMALRWLSGVFASLCGFIGIIALAVQGNKDIRSNPTLGWIIAIVIILGLYPVLGWYFAYPVILLFIPFTFVLLYVEYLRSTFLGRAAKKAQGSDVIDKSETDIGTPYRSFRAKLAPRDVLRNLSGIRWSLYIVLIFFLCLFYFLVTQADMERPDFSFFYQAVIYAYLGILAIVIAFAILVIQRRTQKQATEHLRRALTGLVQMYIVFVLITVTGLLLGTDVNGEILTRSAELSEILSSVDSFLNICRIIAVEFSILAFPAGLLYLHAMIKDFLRS